MYRYEDMLQFECKCGCNRAFSLNHLQKFGLTKHNTVMCKLPQIMCQICTKFKNVLYGIIIYDDDYYSMLDRKVCENCYANQYKKYSLMKSENEAKVREYTEIINTIEDRLTEIKVEYCSLFSRHDEEAKAIKQNFINEIMSLLSADKDRSVIKRTLNNLNIIDMTKSKNVELFDKYAVTIHLVLSNFGIPKGIIHKILLYCIHKNGFISISISPRLVNLYNFIQ